MQMKKDFVLGAESCRRNGSMGKKYKLLNHYSHKFVPIDVSFPTEKVTSACICGLVLKRKIKEV